MTQNAIDRVGKLNMEPLVDYDEKQPGLVAAFTSVHTMPDGRHAIVQWVDNLLFGEAPEDNFQPEPYPTDDDLNDDDNLEGIGRLEDEDWDAPASEEPDDEPHDEQCFDEYDRYLVFVFEDFEKAKTRLLAREPLVNVFKDASEIYQHDLDSETGAERSLHVRAFDDIPEKYLSAFPKTI